jgi:hypothetical protein
MGILMTEDRKHHSTVQPRAQGGQWREPAGPFDHAGKVPAGAPRYGEPVLNRMVQADARMMFPAHWRCRSTW